MTIAGSDSGGGAGIQADLKTIAAHGCYGLSVLTALTAQNTRGVQAIHDVPPAFVRQQLDSVLSDIGCDAAKTGMLSRPEVIEAVAERLAVFAVPNLVVDPVMVSKSGHRLLGEDAVEALVRRLIPMARVITPNAEEAAVLLGRPVRTFEEAESAARDLARLGPRAVLVKGGHLEGADRAVDFLWEPSGVTAFDAPRLDARHTHGTGCTLSAAIAANLGRGLALAQAVRAAKEYLEGAMRNAYEVGGGISPVNHQWRGGAD
ncbi:bifunctional hydroxymethylpyrimidine kinase/phosphomethylpyrimidine kinase [Candidatus Poribacteria bacterium]|nr:bifunctional hydroxymethylpyrimidine kinase/phosphomethylpyrimidine kinase [Candidatus Poribacteria bacterium]